MENKNKGGRPIEKPGRKKIGLSIRAESYTLLAELSARSGKTKSKLFEYAQRIVKRQEDVIYARAKNYEKYGEESLLDFDEYMKNREASKKELEVRNVKVAM